MIFSKGLVINYREGGGGLQNGRGGGQVKFYPYKKGWGGGHKRFEVVLMQGTSVLAVLKGGT